VDATQEAAVAAALAEANVQKYMEGKPLKFSKYIPGRMVTIVV
jgi:leucyl-tRNA synthetase